MAQDVGEIDRLPIGKLSRRRFNALGVGAFAGAFLAPGSVAGVLAATPAGGTLRITTTGDVEILDPNFLLSDVELRVCEMLFNGLVSIDENLNIVPDLATEWTISPDAQVYEFKLRKGVPFHHGREFVADDVAFTLDRFKQSWMANVVADLDRVETPDPYTVRLRFKKPAAHFLGSVAPRWCAIVPRDVVEKSGAEAFKRKPVGTGAYKFVEHVPFQRVVLERNPGYFESGLPKIDRLEWVPVQDESARSMQVIGNEAGLDLWAPLKLVPTFKGSAGISVIGGPTSRYEFADLNNARAPFNKLEVRKAVALATDRQAIVDLALFGNGEALVGGPIGPAGKNPFFNDLKTYAKPNVAKAKALMQAAGLGGGVTIQGLAEGGSRYSDALEVLQQQWGEIGIKININAMEVGALRARRKAGDYDVLIQGWGTLVDPNEYVGEQFRTGGGLNFGKSSNAALDSLIEQGKAEADPVKRKAIYKAIEENLLETSVPMVFLYRPYEFAAFNQKLKDLKHEAGRTRISLAKARLEG